MSNSQTRLDAYWMPFTANRAFAERPIMFTAARGMYYSTADGEKVLDAASGLWCCHLGHCHPTVADAIDRAARSLDYSPAFQIGHPAAFELATRISDMLPGDLNHIFFTNSGSESVDTALKIALAYFQLEGGASRTRLIGRARGYHGVGFGGTSVGGLANNRRSFGPLLGGVDHLPHTHYPQHNAFSRGEPEWGAHCADELERIAEIHGASTIAAVIVEPVAGSAGVLVPPRRYLERLREITARLGILLIFDEVITAFGRLGRGSAAEYFDIEPDIVTLAKGMTAGAVPMGGVAVSDEIYDRFMESATEPVELFHGYTYSGHPLAVAAALAAMDVYESDSIFERAAELSRYFEDAVHTLRDAPFVIDIRNLGLMSGVELAPREGAPGQRARDVFIKALENGVYFRVNGETVAIAPPLIAERRHIDQAVETLRSTLSQVA